MDRAKKTKKYSYSGMIIDSSWKFIIFDRIMDSKVFDCKGFIRCAGVIPYCGDKVCLGKYKDSKDLTHFGGGVKMFESIVEGAKREVREETHDFFDSLSDLSQSPGIMAYRSGKVPRAMIIFFSRVQNTKPEEEFVKHISGSVNPEISAIKWITLAEFRKLLVFEQPTEDGFTLYKCLKNMMRFSGGRIDSFFNSS